MVQVNAVGMGQLLFWADCRGLASKRFRAREGGGISAVSSSGGGGQENQYRANIHSTHTSRRVSMAYGLYRPDPDWFEWRRRANKLSREKMGKHAEGGLASVDQGTFPYLNIMSTLGQGKKKGPEKWLLKLKLVTDLMRFSIP